MTHGAVMVNGDVGFSSADIHKDRSEFLLVFAQNGFADSDWLEHCVGNKVSAAIHGRDDVLSSGRRTGDDVDVHLKASAHHAKRIADPVLVVDHKFLRQ